MFVQRSRLLCLALSLCLLSLAACQNSSAPPRGGQAPAVEPPQAEAAKEAPGEAAAPKAAPSTGDPTRWPEPTGRLVAIGDVHGDLGALEQALRIAGLIDAQKHWAGGDATLVQTGDILDRGNEERAILALLDRLEREAPAEGGRVIRLHGNHEIMNVAGDLRYVTPGGFADFASAGGSLDTSAPALQRLPEAARPRMAALMPGGPVALDLARHNVVAVVGDSVFVHGGLLPKHIQADLEQVNEQVRLWMRGERATPPAEVTGSDSLVWERRFSRDPGPEDCALLRQALEAVPAKRLVVGHTVQRQGINSACDGMVWRIDVGMAAHYGGKPQALQIHQGEVKILGEAPGEAQKE